MKIIIIRHGEPYNEKNTLTEKGFIEVKALSEFLKNQKMDKVYSSPLERAKLTAEAVLKPLNREAIILPWLEEFTHKVTVPYSEERVMNWDFLPNYFVNNKDLYDNEKYLKTDVMKSASIETHHQEVVTAFDKLLEENGYKREGYCYRVNRENRDVIVLFCHLGMMSVLAGHLLNIPYVLMAQGFAPAPSSITTFVSEERQEGIAQFRCLGYGDISHLNIKNLKPSVHGRFCEIFHSDERH